MTDEKAETRGRNIPLSKARKLIGDFLAISQSVPLAHGERRIDIRALREAVEGRRPRFDWLPVFFKAYAIVAANRPALRRLFVLRPWAHLYEHPENIGCVIISRRLEGDDALFYLPISAPERLPLTEIQRILKEAQKTPIAEVPAFRRQVRLLKIPGLFRRVILRVGLNWSTRQRARRSGTFGMSVLASMGIANLTTLVPWTTMIHYTPFDESGSMLLRVAVDHRVIDGLEIAYALREMEEVLNGRILEEVLEMRRKNATTSVRSATLRLRQPTEK
jgi:hypothetical protein